MRRLNWLILMLVGAAAVYAVWIPTAKACPPAAAVSYNTGCYAPAATYSYQTYQTYQQPTVLAYPMAIFAVPTVTMPVQQAPVQQVPVPQQQLPPPAPVQEIQPPMVHAAPVYAAPVQAYSAPVVVRQVQQSYYVPPVAKVVVQRQLAVKSYGYAQANVIVKQQRAVVVQKNVGQRRGLIGRILDNRRAAQAQRGIGRSATTVIVR